MTTTQARVAADRCPGLLRPHTAADGALVRVRLPGGRISADALAVAACATAAHADGDLTLTSRANLQLRGIRPEPDGEAPAELVHAVAAAGLLPSATHELVRNIITSPLTGIIGGHADLRPLTAELDRLLCADPDLARLSGRFLFLLDDGRDDLAGLRRDLGVRAVSAGLVQTRIGALAGPEVPLAAAARWLVESAREFLLVAGGAWGVRELPGAGTELGGRPAPFPAPADPLIDVPAATPAAGPVAADDGTVALVALAPLGLIDQTMAAALVDGARRGSADVVVTPWRSVIVPGLPAESAATVADLLSAAGWVLDPRSGWVGVTACTGAPGCAQAAGPTSPVATMLAQQRNPGGLPVHVVGCERRCGTPAGPHEQIMVTR